MIFQTMTNLVEPYMKKPRALAFEIFSQYVTKNCLINWFLKPMLLYRIVFMK